MLECSDDSVLVNSVRDIVSGCFDIIGGIAHRDADPCIFNDRNIIASVAERHALLTLHSDVFQNL